MYTFKILQHKSNQVTSRPMRDLLQSSDLRGRSICNTSRLSLVEFHHIPISVSPWTQLWWLSGGITCYVTVRKTTPPQLMRPGLIKWNWFNWVTPLRGLANGMWRLFDHWYAVTGSDPAQVKRHSFFCLWSVSRVFEDKALPTSGQDFVIIPN